MLCAVELVISDILKKAQSRKHVFYETNQKWYLLNSYACWMRFLFSFVVGQVSHRLKDHLPKHLGMLTLKAYAIMWSGSDGRSLPSTMPGVHHQAWVVARSRVWINGCQETRWRFWWALIPFVSSATSLIVTHFTTNLAPLFAWAFRWLRSWPLRASLFMFNIPAKYDWPMRDPCLLYTTVNKSNSIHLSSMPAIHMWHRPWIIPRRILI